MEEIADIPNPLPSSSLKESVTVADKCISSTIAEYEDSMDAMPSPPFTKEPTTLLRGDPTQISAAKMYALDLQLAGQISHILRPILLLRFKMFWD
jgi:hypothetical protein